MRTLLFQKQTSLFVFLAVSGIKVFIAVFGLKQAAEGVLDKLLGSCHSLERLSVGPWTLNNTIVNHIGTQNGKTLQGLNMSFCTGLPLGLEWNWNWIRIIVNNCVGLRRLDLGFTYLSQAKINYLVNNVSPKISKMGLHYQRNLLDEHVTALVGRCKNLETLDLGFTGITSNSVTTESPYYRVRQSLNL